MCIRDRENTARNHAAARYTKLLGDAFETPKVPGGMLSSWAQYTLKASSREERDRFVTGMKEQGIPVMIYYPNPLHLQPVYTGLGYQAGDLPVSEKLSETVFSLPMHGYLTDALVGEIAETLLKLK